MSGKRGGSRPGGREPLVGCELGSPVGVDNLQAIMYKVRGLTEGRRTMELSSIFRVPPRADPSRASPSGQSPGRVMALSTSRQGSPENPEIGGRK